MAQRIAIPETLHAGWKSRLPAQYKNTLFLDQIHRCV